MNNVEEINKTLLQKANEKFREKSYKEALVLYKDINESNGTRINKLIEFNIKACEKKIEEEKKVFEIKSKDYLKNKIISDERVVILLHISQPDLAKDIINRIESTVDRNVDLLITCNKMNKSEILKLVSHLTRDYELLVVDDNDCDLSSFIKSYLYLNNKGYKIFCKIHTNWDNKNKEIANSWQASLLDGVLPNKKYTNKIIKFLQENKDISVVGSALNYISYERNKKDSDNYLNKILSKMNRAQPDSDFGFFSGLMFWGKYDDFNYINECIAIFLDNFVKNKVNSNANLSMWNALERCITLPAIMSRKYIGLLDYNISKSDVCFSLRTDKPSAFLKFSDESRYKAYSNINIQSKYYLLQKSGIVNPEWCYYSYNKDAPYDCYQSYIEKEIPYLSSKHKSNELILNWEEDHLVINDKGNTKKINLDSELLTKSILPNIYSTDKPKLISQVDEIMVSVICITYLHEKYLKQALDSMLQQNTKFKYEILISDDCSPDQSCKIIEKYVDKYPDKIIYIKRKENIGARKNSTDLLQRARGKYIAFNEGDDYWTDSNKLQAQVDYLEKTPDCSLCFHQVQVVDEKDEHLVSFFPGKQIKSIFTIEDFIQRNYIQTNSLVFRKNDLGVSSLVDERIMPGDWYRYTLNTLIGDAHLLPQVMSVYRKHSGGIWSSEGKDLHKKWGLQEVVFFNSLDIQLNRVFHYNFFGRKYSLFKICFFYFYQNDKRLKLFELAKVNIDLTNFFMKKHNINFIMSDCITYNEFIDSLSKALSVDIIVTSYNHEKHIEQALISILEQKGLFKTNIYVSDDCSTDRTLDKIKAIACSHSDKIKNISPLENLGLQKNMQQAFSYVKSSFFAICEGDDYWLDESKLRKQVSYLIENQDATMCFNWLLLEYVNKGYSIPHPGQQKIPSDSIDFEYILKTAVTANFSCCMYRSSILNIIPESYYENPRAADWLFNLYAANEGKVGFLRDILSVYRVHDGGQWSKLTPTEQVYRRNEGYKLFSQLFPERKEIIGKYINSNLSGSDDVFDYKKELIFNSNSIRCNLDKVSYDFGFITLSGWAFVIDKSIDFKNNKPWLILLDEKKEIVKYYSCQIIKRPDVKRVVNECELDHCGFKAVFNPYNSIKKDYIVAICFEGIDLLHAKTLTNLSKIIALETV